MTALLTGWRQTERAIALQIICASAHELCARLISEGAPEHESALAARFYDPARKREAPAKSQEAQP